MSDTNPAMRLRPDQKNEIKEAQNIRRSAIDLRNKAQNGQYDDDSLEKFWEITQNAGIILHESNPQLGARAGLGESFFSTVSRDRRRPKLQNYMKALTAIINTADELLYDIGILSSDTNHSIINSRQNFQDDAETILNLSISLAKIARIEIEKLEGETPNESEKLAQNKNTRDLLEIFASSFERIAKFIIQMQEGQIDSRQLCDKTRDEITQTNKLIDTWWQKNRDNTIDYVARVPMFAAGIELLHLAGANMTVATTAISGLILGPSVYKAAKSRGERSKQGER